MLYDYLCEKCGHKYEVIKSEPSIDKCPKCNSCSHRLFSGAKHSIIWKCEGSHKGEYTKYGRKDQTSKEFYEWKAKNPDAWRGE